MQRLPTTMWAGLGLVAALWLGCAGSAVDWTDPHQTVSRVRVQRDDSLRVTTFVGPDIAHERDDSVFLRAWKHDARPGSVDYQIYVKDHYWDRSRFYTRAIDGDGRTLGLTPIARKTTACPSHEVRCRHDEHVGLDVSRDYLRAVGNRGLRLRLAGAHGEETFEIPAGYIQGFLTVAR